MAQKAGNRILVSNIIKSLTLFSESMLNLGSVFKVENLNLYATTIRGDGQVACAYDPIASSFALPWD